MKAAIYRNYGQPDVLSIEEVEKPIPKDNEVLIRVHAATVNRTDCANLTAKPFIMRFGLGLFKPNKPILGTDFAGVIESVGNNISDFKIGDRVFGFDDGGLSSYAEYMTFPADDAIEIIPENISFKEAAASIEGPHYAYNVINKVEVKGKSVLVHGATGGIGSACVQLARHLGATVTATCGTGHEKMLTSLGAVRVINWQENDFTKDKEQFDFVFDMAGKSSFSACKALLKPKGIYISTELGPNAENIPLSLFSKYFGSKSVRFPFPSSRPHSVRMMKKLLADGNYKPVIDRIYTMSEVVDAFRYVLNGQKIGNVVIDVNS
ncbi:MAG: NADPH:quinone reductase-like Zn-dependent oxidoreductase [Bacteroidia bacterium]|jgi:NADPH:quinone reductase-like Zn-dependent oxidoreductase